MNIADQSYFLLAKTPEHDFSTGMIATLSKQKVESINRRNQNIAADIATPLVPSTYDRAEERATELAYKYPGTKFLIAGIIGHVVKPVD
jgi:hypothetical protein